MKNLITILYLCLSLNLVFGCIDGVEVELWGECYNIEETIELDLSSTDVNGMIPPEIGDLVNLERVYLIGSGLFGEIPSEIGNLINIKDIRLYGNELTGNIPLEIGNLVNLEILWISSNQLTGNIPPEIGNLINLFYLNLSLNEMSGVIPDEICNLPLEIVWLGNNKFCPPYPWCIGTDIGSQDILGCVDLNGDQLVNVQDVIILVNYVLDSYYEEEGDLNSDTIINIQDIIILIGIILGN